MSQSSAALGPQRHGQPRIHGCRWAWCRLIFSTNPELVHHVIHEHVQKAVPVKRKDLPILRRAEEGLGESLSLSGFFTYPQLHEEPLTDKGKQSGTAHGDISTELQLSSSLPSPPASSPRYTQPLPPFNDKSCVSPAPEFPEPDSDPEAVSEDEAPIPCEPSPTPARHSAFAALSQHPIPLVRYDSPATPLPRQARYLTEKATPTFAALSSPADSPSMSAIPTTPSFTSQVEGATGKRKRNDGTLSRVPARFKARFRSSIGSHSSFGSQDSVEKQLTQSLGMDDDIHDACLGRRDESDMQHSQLPGAGWANRNTYAAELPWNDREVLGMDSSQMGENVPGSQPDRTPQLLQTPSDHQLQPRTPFSLSGINQPSAAAAPHVQRQPWYGTHRIAPTIRTKSSASAAGFHVPRGAGPLQPLHLKTPTSGQPRRSQPTSPLNVFRSGVLEFVPSAIRAAQVTQHGTMSDDDLDTSSQSQSQTQESSLEYLSYPLQTQAPYESQSQQQ